MMPGKDGLRTLGEIKDLDPLLPALMFQIKIANNAPGQRERNHTIADCVVHFSLTSPLGQGVPPARLQPVEQIVE